MVTEADICVGSRAHYRARSAFTPWGVKATGERADAFHMAKEKGTEKAPRVRTVGPWTVAKPALLGAVALLVVNGVLRMLGI